MKLINIERGFADYIKPENISNFSLDELGKLPTSANGVEKFELVYIQKNLKNYTFQNLKSVSYSKSNEKLIIEIDYQFNIIACKNYFFEDEPISEIKECEIELDDMTLRMLKTADDYAVIEMEEFEYSFNEHRGGDFTDNVVGKCFAFKKEWNVKMRWIDKGWGDYEYYYD